MKFIKLPLFYLSLLCTCLLAMRGELHAAWLVAFTGTAASVPWSDVLAQARRSGQAIFATQTMVATLPVTHEDLSDQCVLLAAEDTIFGTTIPKGDPPKDTVYRAPIDKLDNPRLGGLKEHQLVNRSNVKNRQANRKQIFGSIQHVRETYGASMIAELVKNPAGLTDIIADGKERTLKALKLNQEAIFLSDQDQNEIGSATAGLTRGAVQWGNPNAQPNDELKVPDGYRPAAAQRVAVANAAAITEVLWRTMMLNLRKARQQKIDVMCFATLEAGVVFDRFFREQVPVAGSAVPIRSFNHDADLDAYEEMVTTYVTREGKVSINTTDYLNFLRESAEGLTGDTTNGSAVISGLLNVPVDDDGNSALQPFSPISGTGIPAGAYIVSVDSATQITISANCTATGGDVALKLGAETHMLFTDLKFWEQKTNLVPSHVELTPDGGGKDGYCEMITSLFCTYPALIGSFYTA